MRFGYVCISKKEPDIKKQIEDLRKFGVDEIYQDDISTKKTKRPEINRPELKKLFNVLHTGDILVIWKLDRLGRTVKQFLKLIEEFRKKGINLVSLNEQLDTTTNLGKYCIQKFCEIAQMERSVNAERMISGLDKAREVGKYVGRRPISSIIVNEAKEMYKTNEYTVKEIMEYTGMKRSTLYNYIRNDNGINGKKDNNPC